MTDIGVELAQARERRSLTLDDISRRTKIGVPALQAIERGATQDLPGGIYILGMLRAYAREVGCDPSDIVRRFRDSSDDPALGATLRPPVPAFTSRTSVAEIDAADATSARRYATCIALVLLLVGWFYVTADRKPVTSFAAASRRAPSAQPAPPDKIPAVATSGDARTAKSPVDAQPPAKDAPQLQLIIQPSGPCWLSATADGQQVIYRLLNAGERAQIDAHDDVVLRVGDAGTFSFTINGAAAHAPGAAGEVVAIHITSKNFREFLSDVKT